VRNLHDLFFFANNLFLKLFGIGVHFSGSTVVFQAFTKICERNSTKI